MKLTSWTKTDPGRKRVRNEDNFLADTTRGVFAVADGMGGHQGGQTASRLAVAALARETSSAGSSEAVPERRMTEPMTAVTAAEAESEAMHDFNNPTEPAAKAFSPSLMILRQAARAAGREIYDASRDSEDLRGMGTTLTALLIEKEATKMVGHVLHAGDSRLYQLHGAKLVQLTEDHTWISEQVRAGAITREEGEKSKFRHVITKSIGFERYTEADMFSFEVYDRDVFLLCSDGLSNYIENDELAEIMQTVETNALPEKLVALANERGGDDNITVVVVRVEA